MNANDGGPAFPTESEGQTGNSTWRFEGMTLRDYFAAAALQGLIATIPGPGCAEWTYYSEAAYKIADAMLAERAK